MNRDDQFHLSQKNCPYITDWIQSFRIRKKNFTPCGQVKQNFLCVFPAWFPGGFLVVANSGFPGIPLSSIRY
jgi:hypothetical protein